MEATQRLYSLVKHHIRALHSLQITCHTPLFPIDAIMRHAPSLRVLRFRDHVGFTEEDRPCPTLAVQDLTTLARGLTHVHTLELDMDIIHPPHTDPAQFLQALSRFPSLHTLTLNVQTVIQPDTPVDDETHTYQQQNNDNTYDNDNQHQERPDHDRDAALRTFWFLTQQKPPGAAPWRCIVINVGGWSRVMVRRLSAAWRERNARGIFAERCFVFERSDNGSGDMAFREEKSVEMNLRDGTGSESEDEDDDDAYHRGLLA
jgi:hypothetical protein